MMKQQKTLWTKNSNYHSNRFIETKDEADEEIFRESQDMRRMEKNLCQLGN